MKWFKKEELISCYRERKCDRCPECQLQKAVYSMPNGIDENTKALVNEVLDPARQMFGKPIKVNSGFRCPVHNKAVGGVANSQHVKGEAADIAPADSRQVTTDSLIQLGKIIEELGKYDQLIYYPTFLHVSWKRNGPNRRQTLRKVSNGYEKV